MAVALFSKPQGSVNLSLSRARQSVFPALWPLSQLLCHGGLTATTDSRTCLGVAVLQEISLTDMAGEWAHLRPNPPQPLLSEPAPALCFPLGLGVFSRQLCQGKTLLVRSA